MEPEDHTHHVRQQVGTPGHVRLRQLWPSVGEETEAPVIRALCQRRLRSNGQESIQTAAHQREHSRLDRYRGRSRV